MEDVVRTVAAIERSQTLAALTGAVRDFAGPLGYDRFVLYSATQSKEEVVDHLYWVEGDWFCEGEGVDARTYLQRCPVNHHILETTRPFFWTKRGPAGDETYRVVSHPHGLGIHGLQVPVFGLHGLMGAMSFGGQTIDSSLAVRLALTAIGQAALHRAVSFSLVRQETGMPRLTAREREVMRWIAAGKRQADAALLLGLSERTVENHLRRVRRRLGAATTAEAIRIAIRSGEIVP